jgi:hypothetical protein
MSLYKDNFIASFSNLANTCLFKSLWVTRFQ